MSVGERGGRTTSAEEGFAVIEGNKAFIANQIKADITDWLKNHPEWHRDDLRVDVPAESKNAVGAAVNALIRSGVMEETGERRKSSDPASHGRKSNVYRLAGADSSGADEVTSAAVSSGLPLNDESLARFRSAIRWRITDDLVMEGEFRVESLDDLRIPDAYQFLIREAVDAAKRRHFMEGERGLYKVTPLGKNVLTGLVRDTAIQEAPEPVAEPLPLEIPDAPGTSHYHSEAA